MNRARWTAHEDELLLGGLDKHGCPQSTDEESDWKVIASCVPGRTNKQVRKRWLHSLDPGVKKTGWTPAEDEKLIQLHRTHGTKWAVIASKIPGRTDDACSKRYRDALDPTLKTGPWEPGEDAQLLELYSRMGSKWRDIGLNINRASLHCRNRWRLLDRRQKSSKSPSPPATAVPSGSEFDPSSMTPPGGADVQAWGSQQSLDWDHWVSSASMDLEPLTSDTYTALYDLSMPSHNAFNPGSQSMSDPISSIRSLPQVETGYASESDAQFPPPYLQFPFQSSQSSHYTVQQDWLNLPIEPSFDTLGGTANWAKPSEPTLGSPGFWSASGQTLSSASSSHAPRIYLPEHSQKDWMMSPDEFQQPSPADTYDSSSAHSTPFDGFNALSPPHSPMYTNQYLSPVGMTQSPLQSQTSPLLPVPVPLPLPAQDADHFASTAIPSESILFSQSMLHPTSLLPHAIHATDPPLVTAASDQPSGKVTKKIPKRPKPSQPDIYHTAPRLSRTWAVSTDPRVRPYCCIQTACVDQTTQEPKNPYTTARELSEHVKDCHNHDPTVDKPFKCGLDGCGKLFKNINGLQYHLQLSADHFRSAISSRFSKHSPMSRASAALEGSTSPAISNPELGEFEEEDPEEVGKRMHECPHVNCFKTYKSSSGLRYHIKHAHCGSQPTQLDNLSPALEREINHWTQRMRLKRSMPHLQQPSAVISPTLPSS